MRKAIVIGGPPDILLTIGKTNQAAQAATPLHPRGYDCFWVFGSPLAAD